MNEFISKEDVPKPEKELKSEWGTVRLFDEHDNEILPPDDLKENEYYVFMQGVDGQGVFVKQTEEPIPKFLRRF